MLLLYASVQPSGHHTYSHTKSPYLHLQSELTGCHGQVQWVAPAAAGAGTSLVIAYLNGNAVPDLLSWRSLLVKWAGTICSVSANLTFGPEAPMVHLGACTAQLATHFVSGTSGFHGYGGQEAS